MEAKKAGHATRQQKSLSVPIPRGFRLSGPAGSAVFLQRNYVRALQPPAYFAGVVAPEWSIFDAVPDLAAAGLADVLSDL